jgi:hypothetical protein
MTESSKHPWVSGLPTGEPLKASLARLVEEDGARDQAEVEYYEAAADPRFEKVETVQRRYLAQFRRRLRHRESRGRHPENSDG